MQTTQIRTYFMSIEKGDFFGIGNDSCMRKTKNTSSSSFFRNEFTKFRRKFSKSSKRYRYNHNQQRRNLYS